MTYHKCYHIQPLQLDGGLVEVMVEGLGVQGRVGGVATVVHLCSVGKTASTPLVSNWYQWEIFADRQVVLDLWKAVLLSTP